MTYRRRRRDGATQSLYRKVWDAEKGRWDFSDYGWKDCAPDEPETRHREPGREGMVIIPVDEFADGALAVVPIGDVIAALS